MEPELLVAEGVAAQSQHGEAIHASNLRRHDPNVVARKVDVSEACPASCRNHPDHGGATREHRPHCQEAAGGSALCQADIAYWAFHGTGEAVPQKQGAVSNLRAIANLYPETMHIVTRTDRKIDDLRPAARQDRVDGRAELLDAAHREGDAANTRRAGARDQGAEHRRRAGDIEALRDGKIDAFFLMTSVPTPRIRELADAGDFALLPIDGANARHHRRVSVLHRDDDYAQ